MLSRLKNDETLTETTTKNDVPTSHTITLVHAFHDQKKFSLRPGDQL